MKQILYIIIAILCLNNTQIALAQSEQLIDVESFKKLENDMDARVAHPVKDQNGATAALIKVVTTQNNFSFEAGMMGVVKTEQKVGEIWVYIPKGVNNITIKHPQLGILRNYFFPIAIQEATVYELKLVTGKVTTVVDENAGGQYLIINYTPKDAPVEIYIGEVYTPANNGHVATMLKYGEHNYRIVASRFETEAGIVNIGAERVVLDVELKSSCGIVNVESIPENGADVYLDGQKIGITPMTIKNIEKGKHQITLRHKYYLPQTKTITVVANTTTQEKISLSPNFADIKVTIPQNTTLTINDKIESQDTESTHKLTSGLYNLKAQREGHRPSVKQIEVKAQKNMEVVLEEPTPMYGTLNISTPGVVDATILIDDKNRGFSPNIVEKVLVGERMVKISKEGFQTKTLKISVKEGVVHDVEVILNANAKLTASPSLYSFTEENNSATIKINAPSSNWEIVNYPDWCRARKSGDNIIAIAQANTTSSRRSGAIEVEYNGQITTIQVQQQSAKTTTTSTTPTVTTTSDKQDQKSRNYWSDERIHLSLVMGIAKIFEDKYDAFQIGASAGFTFGNRHGMYGKILMFIPGDDQDDSEYENLLNRASYNIGYTYSIANFLIFNLGGGVGTVGFGPQKKDMQLSANVEFEAGLTIRIANTTLNFSVATYAFKTLDLRFGIGFII